MITAFDVLELALSGVWQGKIYVIGHLGNAPSGLARLPVQREKGKTDICEDDISSKSMTCRFLSLAEYDAKPGAAARIVSALPLPRLDYTPFLSKITPCFPHNIVAQAPAPAKVLPARLKY